MSHAFSVCCWLTDGRRNGAILAPPLALLLTTGPAVSAIANVEDEGEYEPDPLFTNSLHEAKWILAMWVTCFVWTLTVCLTQGYPDSVTPETFPTVFGIPAWVAYGIALPWCIANVVTIVFCLAYMKDGDLGDDGESTAASTAESGGEDA